jgi:hypothetical protein
LAAAEAGVATQMGIQIHANDNYPRVVELIQSGAIGPVREVHVWTSRAWGWQSPEAAKRNRDIVSATERPAGSMPVRRLHSDLWIGPREPFHEVYFRARVRWWDFGNGTSATWAFSGPALLGLKDHPRPSKQRPTADRNRTASMQVTCQYGVRETAPASVTWYQARTNQKSGRSGIRSGPTAICSSASKAWSFPITGGTSCCLDFADSAARPYLP